MPEYLRRDVLGDILLDDLQRAWWAYVSAFT